MGTVSGEMINKNLRSVLYYVTGVTIVCLMIEFSKRVPAGGLDSRLYVVETAKESELASLPKSPPDEIDYDIIPKRDRGRVKSTKQPRKLEEPESIENTIDTEELIDYPEGLDEYEPPNLDHSCSDFTITDSLLERSKSVEAACSRLHDELGDQRKLYSRLRWAVPERLLYCPVFKAASTSWLINYLKLSNSTTDPKNGN